MHEKKSTNLLVIISEPLVVEDTCALSADTQSHPVVHGYTHRNRMAHYDNF